MTSASGLTLRAVCALKKPIRCAIENKIDLAPSALLWKPDPKDAAKPDHRDLSRERGAGPLAHGESRGYKE